MSLHIPKQITPNPYGRVSTYALAAKIENDALDVRVRGGVAVSGRVSVFLLLFITVVIRY